MFFQSWKDRRLRWDQIDWKTDTLNIKSFGRLWVPDINSEKWDIFEINQNHNAKFYEIGVVGERKVEVEHQELWKDVGAGYSLGEVGYFPTNLLRIRKSILRILRIPRISAKACEGIVRQLSKTRRNWTSRASAVGAGYQLGEVSRFPQLNLIIFKFLMGRNSLFWKQSSLFSFFTVPLITIALTKHLKHII